MLSIKTTKLLSIKITSDTKFLLLLMVMVVLVLLK
jgi:hypothetical protein